MLTGSGLSTAIAAILFGAVCIGFLLHLLWSHLTRSRSAEAVQLEEMAVRLHEMEAARDDAEAARERAEVLLGQRQEEHDERVALMQRHSDEASERIAQLEAELEDCKSKGTAG